MITDGWVEPAELGRGVRVAPATDGPTDTGWATVPGSGSVRGPSIVYSDNSRQAGRQQ